MISFNKIRLSPEKGRKGQAPIESWIETVPRLCTTISYNKGEDTIEIQTWDQPAPSFWRALQTLAGDVNDICELRLESIEEIHSMLRVLSVSLSHAEIGDGITITALRKLAYPAPLVVNTPHLLYASQNKDGIQIPPECRMHLNGVFAEALRFLEGYRSQMGLFDEAV